MRVYIIINGIIYLCYIIMTCVGESKVSPMLYICYTVSVHIMANNARSLLVVMYASGC